jgi:6-phosphogluconolactonase/glucosamine-6-phosphate isomerase/deaminase
MLSGILDFALKYRKILCFCVKAGQARQVPCRRYARATVSGIDLAILGFGSNGHIIFNDLIGCPNLTAPANANPGRKAGAAR